MTACEPSGAAGPTRLLDIVFPGDANHHGTLFGGVALAHMDKAAFIAASRHAPVDFVTASCERIDFIAPARVGDIIDVSARLVRVGRRSLSVEAELVAEPLVSGMGRRCSIGVFNMVAVGPRAVETGESLPPLGETGAAPQDPDVLRSAGIVFPEMTSHYGNLFGGQAFALMGKAAFIKATRHCRKPVVMASTREVNFTSQIHTGEIVETCSRLTDVGRSSMTITVELWAENPRRRQRRHCGRAEFVMVALGEDQKPAAIAAA